MFSSQINYWRREGETEAKDYRRQTILGQTNRGRIIGLEPNTYYTFNVMVFNAAGNGPRSSVYEERTWRKGEWVDSVMRQEWREYLSRTLTGSSR